MSMSANGFSAYSIAHMSTEYLVHSALIVYVIGTCTKATYYRYAHTSSSHLRFSDLVLDKSSDVETQRLPVSYGAMLGLKLWIVSRTSCCANKPKLSQL